MNASLARKTWAVCVDATAPSAIVHTMSTVKSGRVRTTRLNPSFRSRRWPWLAATAPCRLPAEMRRTSKAETRNEPALIQYATSGLEAATSAPPITGAIVQLTFSPVWMSEFARVRSDSSTRLGNPA